MHFRSVKMTTLITALSCAFICTYLINLLRRYVPQGHVLWNFIILSAVIGTVLFIDDRNKSYFPEKTLTTGTEYTFLKIYNDGSLTFVFLISPEGSPGLYELNTLPDRAYSFKKRGESTFLVPREAL